jgi:hypothetical protein
MSSNYKLEGQKNIVLNILYVFICNNGITNILNSKFRPAIYASYIAVTRPLLSLNDCGKKIYLTGIKCFVKMVQALKHVK